MSSIYIQEPPTSGKVLLVTSVGDIDVELWCKEAPKACRNFVQLCLEGHYDDCQFLRVVPGFIAQCGDPDCEGDASRNIYGKPFRDEFHSRLRFVRRGLLAMANAGRNDNGTQFFFTLNAAPELQNKHTVFGKVTGNTLYNMLKLEEGEIQDDRPVYPQKILRTEVLLNPFDDMVPRKTANSDSKQTEVKKPKSKSSATKNFKLLSFGDEAEEDEEETIEAGRQFSVKSKSSHDLTDDPRLSSVPAVLQNETSTAQSRPRQQDGAPTEQLSSSVDSLRKKLKKDPVEEKSDRYRLFQDENDASAAQVARAKEEYTNLKKEMLKSKRGKDKEEEAAETDEKTADTEAMREYKQQLEPFRNKKSTASKKGSTREQQTMAMLAKFKSKLFDAREQHQGQLPAALPDDEEVEESDETWMWHRLEVQDGTASAVVAKDANTKKDDWYDINDPRNDINQRRRQQKQTQS